MKNTILYGVTLTGLILSGCSTATRSSNTASVDSIPAPPAPEIINPGVPIPGTPPGSGVTSGAAVSPATNASATAPATAAQSGDPLGARLTEWRLSDADVEAALNSGITIVRAKDSTDASATAAIDDSLAKSMIQSKLKADAQTAAATIEVEAREGEVTLKGSARSASTIARAVALALDTQGVTKVSSELKIDGRTNPN